MIELDTNVPTNWPCDSDPTASCCQLQRTVMHELGHALGFGHSEPGNSGSIPETYIPGTDPDDENSVYISGGNRDFCEEGCLFSKGDLLALSILYPSIHPQDAALEGPVELCEGEIGTYCVTGLPDGYTTTITANGNSVTISNGHCLDISFPNSGVFTVSSESCLDDCCVEDCCIDLWISVTVLPEDGECFCICEAQEQYGVGSFIEVNNIKGVKSIKDPKSNIEEWKHPIDCCDPRPCSELIPGWWYEYLVDADECFKKESECTPPAVSLSGPSEICIGQSAEYCISGSFNAGATWSASGGPLNYSSAKCRNYTPSNTGSYTVSVEVCSIEDGEGQEECCVTISKSVNVVECVEECFCRCWVQEQSGDDPPYQEDIPIDCDDTGDCADIIPDWWYEYLLWPVDCEKIN